MPPIRFYDSNIAVTAQGQYHSSTPSLIDKESAPLQVDSAGNLLVNVAVGAPGGGGGPATIADGADVTQGAIADAAVTSDVNGTLSAKLRGLVKILADAWDSANHRIKVDGSGVTQPVSGTVSVTNFTSPLPVTGAFFQATQPVSGTVSVANFQNPLPVTGSFFQATQPVSGTFFQNTQPVSAASLPLPANASQETGGNLASLVLQTRNDAQIIDVLNCILAQLKLLNLNLASAMPSAHVDSDTWVMDTLPTVQ
jgi:hypothetical protein